MQKDEFVDIDWTNPEEGIWVDKGEVGDIRRESGSPLPQFVENDMMQSIQEIDNIMGTHSTTRGERQGRETATGRQLLRESDRGRIDVLGRRLEEGIAKLFKGWTQIIKVFYTEKKLLTVLNEENTRTFLEFSRASVKQGMQIEVIPGTLIPEDKASRQQRALTLANSQMISPIDLYKEFGMQNPEEVAKRLFLWQNDPMQLFPDLQQQQQAGDVQAKEGTLASAEDSIKKLMAGEPIPVPEGIDQNYLMPFQDFMSRPEFKDLATDIQQAFIDHATQAATAVEETLNQQL